MPYKEPQQSISAPATTSGVDARGSLLGVSSRRMAMFDAVGDGTGSVNANGNYSAGATTFKTTAPPNLGYVISSLDWLIADGAGAPLHNLYGIIPALGNGITMELQDGNGVKVFDVLGGTIKDNADLMLYANNVHFEGTATDPAALSAHFDFEAAGYIYLLSGYSLVITLNDDFSGLTKHQFRASGYTI